METRFTRTEMLMGPENVRKLHSFRVAVFGLGGVGGPCAESLARVGIGALDLIDHDTVSLSNINRQIIATQDSVGKLKTDVMEQRIHSIGPEIIVEKYPVFYLPENRDSFPFEKWDYIVDAIDTVTAKLDLIMEAQKRGIPVISSMGTGNRLDPSKLICTDLFKTSGDPLAKVMRKECKKRGIDTLKVVTSTEEPVKPLDLVPQEEKGARRSIPSSSPFVPPAAGYLIASVVVRDLLSR